MANSRARLRMTTLYQVASTNKGIVVGTGNKIEDFGVGFYTKYGDGGVDISPIADCTKTQVWEIALKMSIIQDIIEAQPTDGLWDDDRTDEDQLGISYNELEWAMTYMGNYWEATEREQQIIDVYNRHRKINKHKMEEIPVYIMEDSL